MKDQRLYHFPYLPESYRPNFWDAIVFVAIFGIFAMISSSATKMSVPFHLGDTIPISLDPQALPGYALRTVIRMFIAMIFSLFFSLTLGTLAAKSRYAERVIIPAIDILQSVPILGFLSITIVGFIMLFPNSLLGPECACIFAIFTSQAWNMILSVYQSIKTLPDDLLEVTSMYRLSAWQRFWRLEMPFSIPSLLWNMMLSMSAGWFFLVAAEAISVANQTILLPGIGSYISVAIKTANMTGVVYAIITMLIVIVMYDQLFFRPLIKWSEKFKFEDLPSDKVSKSWVLATFSRTKLFHRLSTRIGSFFDSIIDLRCFLSNPAPKPHKIIPQERVKQFNVLWDMLLLSILMYCCYRLVEYVLKTITTHEISHVFLLGAITAFKICILLIFSSLIWVPLGVWVGMRPSIRRVIQPIAQFAAAFPANLLFPFFVILIVKYSLNVTIWTTPLMIIGTQWYILFNIIAGASNIPTDLLYVTSNFGVKGWLWWKRLILPSIFPYYITGALTAAGGAWNASIVTEVVSWGDTTLVATGLGAYIAQYTTSGDFPRIFLGIGVMSLYVVTFNVLFWQRLYAYAQSRYRVN